jgi:hypothetical protein
MSAHPEGQSYHPRQFFSAGRLWFALTVDGTRQIEILMAGLFYFMRGQFLIRLGYIEDGIETFLRGVGLSELRLGVLCIIVGTLHFYAAGTDSPRFRATVAMAGGILAIAVIVAFQAGAPDSWFAVELIWRSALLAEFYIGLRHYITIREEKARGKGSR